MLKNDMSSLISTFEELRYDHSVDQDLASKAAGLEYNSLSVIYNAAPDVFIKSYEVFKR